MSEPILITGYGWISPLGSSASANDFDKNLFSGVIGVQARAIELPSQPIVHVPIAPCDFDHSRVQSASKVPLDRGAAMALSAAKDALLQAGLAKHKEEPGSAANNNSSPQVIDRDIDRGIPHSFELTMGDIDSTRVGVFWGSGMAGAFSFDQTAEQIYQHGKRVRPTSVVTIMPNSAAAELALLIKAQGACMTYACACASSSVAMGEALRALRAGWLDVALVGGSESMLTPGVLASWNALRVLSPLKDTDPQTLSSACRPFNQDRSGFALGEGAGAFVLERQSHAQRRGAVSKFALTGYASNCDATHMTLPDAAGQERAIRAALKDANLNASDIGYVNAHATATTAGDAAEVSSVAEVLGTRVPISSTKAQFGHLLGAAGALEMIASIKALEHQSLPPNANLNPDGIDPNFKLNFVGKESKSNNSNTFGVHNKASQPLRHVLSNSFAFGGTNAVLIASLIDGLGP